MSKDKYLEIHLGQRSLKKVNAKDCWALKLTQNFVLVIISTIYGKKPTVCILEEERF